MDLASVLTEGVRIDDGKKCRNIERYATETPKDRKNERDICNVIVNSVTTRETIYRINGRQTFGGLFCFAPAFMVDIITASSAFPRTLQDYLRSHKEI